MTDENTRHNPMSLASLLSDETYSNFEDKGSVVKSVNEDPEVALDSQSDSLNNVNGSHKNIDKDSIGIVITDSDITQPENSFPNQSDLMKSVLAEPSSVNNQVEKLRYLTTLQNKIAYAQAYNDNLARDHRQLLLQDYNSKFEERAEVKHVVLSRLLRNEATARVLFVAQETDRQRKRMLRRAQRQRQQQHLQSQLQSESTPVVAEGARRRVSKKDSAATTITANSGEGEELPVLSTAPSEIALTMTTTTATKARRRRKPKTADGEDAKKLKSDSAKAEDNTTGEAAIKVEGETTVTKRKRRPKGSKAADEKAKSDAQGDEKPKLTRKSKGTKRKLTDSTTETAVAATDTTIDATLDDKKGIKSVIKPTADAEKAPSQKEVKAIARLYNNVYEGIWKDMARKDAQRTYRVVQQAHSVRHSNARKTAVLAAKEARRWLIRTNKNVKDIQARSRRSMREMLSFWKRNEREERDLRKRAEREALESAKREDEDRESRRQARKLNFLITQTELYSHFIGRKIKTDEASGLESAKIATISSTDPVSPTVTANSAATDINSMDFGDHIDDDTLRQTAMINAQIAIQQTREKANQFNGTTPAPSASSGNIDLDGDELNFQNPTSFGDVTVAQPSLLSCQLKEYQLKGLNWLANLYEQGINGILADEMGLGKTVQSISLMAYLAEKHNIWGPFLVISPASTLHNWQQEISRFVPEFKVLPYWGNGKDRKILRKFWDRKNVTYTKDSPFHVLVTSYQLVVADSQYFNRVKWQYMILDEAQAIKSSTSSRWKSLLSFQCRNRLLLTGTPIQNSMQELWALLHFIMPSLFDSHDEFSEWFSKDIENHAKSDSQLNEQQLRRLHMILKPFMLRRVKKHVQSELGDKIEIDVYCDLTHTQRILYRVLKSQINLKDILEKATSGSDESTQSIMNLVMQFRKVCNHPDLFERADVKSAFNFARFGQSASLVRQATNPELFYSAHNPIDFIVPKMLYRDGGILNVPNASSPAGFVNKVINTDLSIWLPSYIQESSKQTHGYLPFINTSVSELHKTATAGILERALEDYKICPTSASRLKVIYDGKYSDRFTPQSRRLLIREMGALDRHESSPIWNELLTVGENYYKDQYMHVQEPAFELRATAPPINFIGRDHSLLVEQENTLFNEDIFKALYPMTLDQEWHLLKERQLSACQFPPSNLLPNAPNSLAGYNTIRMPSMSRFIASSGKLAQLDQMLPELKAQDHRILIYFQMTKMMDLMEEYLTFRQYKYCRLDGSSKLSERRDLVDDWQTKPELFIFLLSTRAGGLGINLTAADTVIFYDSDWNPTIDSQAMDRAHRLGQTRQVTVYRLLVKGTIEERMRDRAKQKMHVQQVVMEGKGASMPTNTSTSSAENKREMALLLLDDDADVDAALAKQHQNGGKRVNGTSANDSKRRKKVNTQKTSSLEDMYHDGEGNFADDD
ncbi:hypothetical protein NADFUDRAFT_52805 [Nadsonia fulvescens var. elongata DSM 6958]|uniref:Chromatin-remodeling ATPase INO80 n=1 Tax=Nadsonia fulvescens var. elongata DSM 6958 TaxID=857566 RepID=A0A1E3PF31_9ASCO|nr:hypothetical protein NADFUDRAFT_52805 [Nadsonia fulvescens var. elongata DSM 6958]